MWNDDKFNAIEKSVLWFLFNRKNHDLDREDANVISEAINVDKALCELTVANIMNEGYIARIIDTEGGERYVLSLEGFEYMSSLSLDNKIAYSD